MEILAIAAASAFALALIFGGLPGLTQSTNDAQAPIRAIAATLHSYVMGGGRDKLVIGKAQEKMGALKVDGIAGPLTHARVEQILGFAVAWPKDLDSSAVPPQNTAYPTSPGLSPASSAPKRGPKPATKPKAKAAPCPPCAPPTTANVPKPVIPSTSTPKALPAYASPSSPSSAPLGEPGPLESFFSALTSPKESAPKPVTAPAAAAPKTPTRVETTSKSPAAAVAPSTTDNQKRAANELYDYYTQAGRDKPTIATYQKVMGGITADGIVGPLTQARVKKLTGKTIPLSTTKSSSTPASSPAPKASSTPKSSATPKTTAPSAQQKQSAESLYKYYKGGGRDKTLIANYQRTMGGITADGLVGPVTKGRVKTLTGKVL